MLFHNRQQWPQHLPWGLLTRLGVLLSLETSPFFSCLTPQKATDGENAMFQILNISKKYANVLMNSMALRSTESKAYSAEDIFLISNFEKGNFWRTWSGFMEMWLSLLKVFTEIANPEVFIRISVLNQPFFIFPFNFLFLLLVSEVPLFFVFAITEGQKCQINTVTLSIYVRWCIQL